MEEKTEIVKKVESILKSLESAHLLSGWTSLSKMSMNYLEKEWGPENPPDLDTIISVIESFGNSSAEVAKIHAYLSDEDFDLLLGVMAIGFDQLINGTGNGTGEKRKTS